MTLSLRELSPAERFSVMVDAISRYPFDLVVIDGIADLQRNTNDLEESDALVGALMSISTKTNTHILCVLHTNPGSDKARGHLGSSLQRKAETVIYVHRNGECSVVEPQFCRNEPFERFAFAVNEEGIPELCDIPQSESFSVNDRIVDILNTEYGGVVERATLTHKLCEVLSLSRTTASMRIKRLCLSGVLSEDGNLVRSQACHNVTMSQGVPHVTDVTDVTTTIQSDVQRAGVSAKQSELSLDFAPPHSQYYGHYDEDECPF